MTALQPNVSTALADAVRQSGVKDSLAQPIIERLLKIGQDLRKATPDRAAHTPDEVQSILTDELRKAQGLGPGIMNPLLAMDGSSCICRNDTMGPC